MSIKIATFADLGNKKNLKTDEISRVISKFIEEKQLEGVICRINTNFYFKNTKSAINIFLHFFLKIIELFIPRRFLFVRKLEENLLDKKTAKSMKKDDTFLFYPEYFFHKSLKEAKLKNIKTIGIASMAHPNLNSKIEEEEFSIFKVAKKNYRYKYYKELADITNKDENFDYVVAYSDFVKNSYLENGFPEKNIYVAFSDINPFFLKAQNKKNRDIFSVLFVAHINPLKGLHYLLDAWITLSLKNAELVIIGEFTNLPKEFSDYYEKIIKSDSSIKMIGHVSNKDIMKYYEEASLFVFPSLTEGNPRVVMEAMASGLPVITTENAKSLVIDGETGFIVPIRDSKSICDKIRWLYENPHLASLMGEKSRKIIINKEVFSDKIFKIYTETCISQIK